MTEKLEGHYLTMYKRVESMKAPLSFTNPVANIFVDRRSIINSIIKTFGELNNVMESIGIGPVDGIDDTVEVIRSVRTSNDRLPMIMVKVNETFNRCKGKCLKELLNKIEAMK